MHSRMAMALCAGSVLAAAAHAVPSATDPWAQLAGSANLDPTACSIAPEGSLDCDPAAQASHDFSFPFGAEGAAGVAQNGSTLTPCEKDLEDLFRRGYGSHSFAMLDSFGKTYNDAGKWDECRSLPPSAKAQYCLLRASETTFGQDGFLGLCVPSSCSGYELSLGGNLIFKRAKAQLGIKDNVSIEVDCSEAETAFDAKAVVCLVLVFLLIALCVLATVVDLAEQRIARYRARKMSERGAINAGGEGYERLIEEGDATAAAGKGGNVDGSAPSAGHAGPGQGPSSSSGASSSSTTTTTTISSSSASASAAPSGASAARLPMWYRALQCFRVNHNLRRLNSPNPVDNLTALNGLRVISILGVILGHTHLYMLNVGVKNPAYVIYHVMSRWSVVFITGCELFVDIFFFLSGFLVSYGVLKELGRKKRIPWAMFYIHRYLRLTPAYAFVLFVYVALSPYAGEGPNWPRYQRTLGFPNLTTANCRDYWWGNMLYINNFYPRNFEAQCFKHSWFLANDFQFYIVAPIFLLSYHKSRRLGWIVTSATLAGCLVLRLILVEAYDTTLNQGDTKNYINVIYGKPYMRFPAYLVGIITAFLYDQTGRKYRMRPATLVAGSVVAGITLIASFYGKKNFFEHPPSFHWDRTRNDLFIIFSSFAASAGAAWFMFISFIGDGGLVRSLLGAHFWTPLARLTYSAYLVHPMIISVVYYSMRNFITYSTVDSVYYMIGHSIIAYGLSLIIFCIIEKPGLSLEMLMFAGKRKSKK